MTEIKHILEETGLLYTSDATPGYSREITFRILRIR